MRFFIAMCLGLITLLYSFNGEASVRDGLYIGAGCGGTFDHLEYKATNLANSNLSKKGKNRSHFLGTAFLGYGFTFDCCNTDFYLGIEAGTSFPKRSVKVLRPGATFTDQIFVNHMSIQEYVNVDALPGYRFCNDILVYGRIGGSFANLKFSQDANAAANLTALHKKSDQWGVRLGAGINYDFCEWLGIGIDYIYTRYDDISLIRRSTNTKHAQSTHTQYVGVSIIVNFPSCGW